MHVARATVFQDAVIDAMLRRLPPYAMHIYVLERCLLPRRLPSQSRRLMRRQMSRLVAAPLMHYASCADAGFTICLFAAMPMAIFIFTRVTMPLRLRLRRRQMPSLIVYFHGDANMT